MVIVEGPREVIIDWISGEVRECVISRAVRCMRSRGMSQRFGRGVSHVMKLWKRKTLARAWKGVQTGNKGEVGEMNAYWERGLIASVESRPPMSECEMADEPRIRDSALGL